MEIRNILKNILLEEDVEGILRRMYNGEKVSYVPYANKLVHYDLSSYVFTGKRKLKRPDGMYFTILPEDGGYPESEDKIEVIVKVDTIKQLRPLPNVYVGNFSVADDVVRGKASPLKYYETFERINVAKLGKVVFPEVERGSVSYMDDDYVFYYNAVEYIIQFTRFFMLLYEELKDKLAMFPQYVFDGLIESYTELDKYYKEVLEEHDDWWISDLVLKFKGKKVKIYGELGDLRVDFM